MAEAVDVPSLLSETNQVLNGSGYVYSQEDAVNKTHDEDYTFGVFDCSGLQLDTTNQQFECNSGVNTTQLTDTSSTKTNSKGMIRSDLLCFINTQLSNTPRDVFISSLVEKSKGSIEQLETLRLSLLTTCKQSKEFPYPDSVLKRRKRSKQGEKLERKLAKDCFYLFRGSLGDLEDELYDILNMGNKRSGEPVSDSQLGHTISSISETIASMQRDLATMKGEYTQDVECLYSKVTKLEKSNCELKSELRSAREETVILRQALDKCEERLHDTQNMLEIRKKEAHKETSVVERNFPAIMSSIAEIKEDIKSVEQRTDKQKDQCQKSIEKLTKNCLDMKSTVSSIRQKIDYGCLDISRISDERSLGVASLKSKLTLLRQDHSDLESGLKSYDSKIQKSNSVIGDLQKRINNVEKEQRRAHKATSYADVVSSVVQNKSEESEKRPSPVQASPLPQVQPAVISSAEVNQPIPEVVLDTTPSYCTVTENAGTAEPQNKEQNHAVNKTLMVPVVENATIEVHVGKDICAATKNMSTNFIAASPRYKTARYYIGRISKDCPEQAIRNYMMERGVTVTHLRLFNRPEKYFQSAQINVLLDDKIHVENVDFWPRDIIVKPWLSRRLFWENIKQRKAMDSDTDYQANRLD